LSLTVIDTPCPSATIAQGSIVTVALPVIEMLLGTRCVTPSPAQVSFAATLAECVMIDPFGWPQGTAATVTVTVAVALLVASSVLVARIVNAPAATAVNVAVNPLGVSVPPVGVALQFTVPLHDELALTVAVSVEVAPAFTVAGLALTATLLTAQVGGGGLLVLPVPQPHCTSSATPAQATDSARQRRAA
jgi:hypothetical protein